MEMSDSKSVKRLAKSLIWVMVSLEVFACSFAAIVLFFSKEGPVNVFDLIYYLALLPLMGFIVFIIFLWIAKIICSNSKKAIEETQKPSKNINSIKEIVKEIQNQLGKMHEQL